jgi:hypothetical protein
LASALTPCNVHARFGFAARPFSNRYAMGFEKLFNDLYDLINEGLAPLEFLALDRPFGDF